MHYTLEGDTTLLSYDVLKGGTIMNNKLKKILAVVLSALMMFSVTNVAFAADHEHEYSETVVNPTCVQGYTLHTCACGDSYKDNYTEPVAEHNLVNVIRTVEPTCTSVGYQICLCATCRGEVVNTNSYKDKIPHPYETSYTYNVATDDYTQHNICTTCSDHITDDGYYAVTLYKTLGDGTRSLIAETYAKAGGAPIYEGNPTLSKAENDAFAKWRFLGWGDDVVALEELAVTENNTDIEAKFEGIEVWYNVYFQYYDSYGNWCTKPSQAVYYKNDATIPTDIPHTINLTHHSYSFKGWDGDGKNIQNDTYIRALYDTDYEQVKVIFYDYNNEIISTVFADYGSELRVIQPASEVMERPADNNYTYAFQGWMDGSGAVKTNVVVEGGILNLYPSYYRMQRGYEVTIRAYYKGEAASNASYQILYASNGNLKTAGFCNLAGEARVSLPYDTFVVKIASEDKLKAGEKTFIVNTSGTAQTLVQVDLVDNEEYYEEEAVRCSCICHSIISPIWIRILNILYSFFNIRYVCCNDMFATHGNSLKYTR